MPPTAKPKITSTAAFARYVGLARTTVSRVLNNQPGLRAETVARVRRAMEEVGFSPNPYAVFLLRGKTGTVGICLRHMDSPAIHEKVFILQRLLRERGYTALIELTWDDRHETERVTRHFMLMRVEAVVFLGGYEQEHIKAAARLLSPQDTPALLADQVEYSGFNMVTLNRSRAMEELVVHLHGLGHRMFGLLGIRLNFLFNQSRILGIKRGLERCGLSFDTAVEIVPLDPHGSRSYDYGRKLAEAFLARGMPATAFLGLNDEVAIGAMWRFQEAGLRVPADLSITGFNHQEISQHVTPRLTTIDQQIEVVMAAVADQVLDLIANPGKRLRKRVIEAKLILADSVGPAPKR